MVRRTVGLMLLWAAGCQGQTVGDSGTGGAAGLPGGTGGTGGTGSGGAGSGGASTGGAGGAQTGPGPHGALPTGYCCTTDEDCRYRACLEFGGVKVCSDRCMSNAACATGPGFVCSKATEQCEPGGTPSCIPGDQWKLGAQPIGACCVAAGDGTAGEECQGNLCMAFGPTSNPFICTHACDTPKDCPANYKCETQVGFCWPYATDYTCQ